MKQCVQSEVIGIASRDLAKAQHAARELGIPRAYGSYEAALADPDVDVIYNPLPNHLHIPWSIRAIAAGKHVLCEKPVATSAEECRQLMAARDQSAVRVGEAFMIRSHPQWVRALDLVHSGQIGELKCVEGVFSYNITDPGNVRNVAEYGGGGLWDIGCYLTLASRMFFRREPVSVSALVDRDPRFGIDRLASVLLGFPEAYCALTCGTQMVPYQRIQVFGTNGRVEIEIPFNAPPDQKCRIFVQTGSDPSVRVEEFDICDQYTIQADRFSRAVLNAGEVDTPLEDSLRNIAVIEAIFEAARTARTIQL